MEKTVLIPAPLTVRLANTQTVFVRVLQVGKGIDVQQVALSLFSQLSNG